MQKMFVVIPPQKKAMAELSKDAEMYERVPLKAIIEGDDV